jgi:tRNA modification GTPase
VELADTAGLRRTEDATELQGIARARVQQAQADLILLVLDRSVPLQASDRQLIAESPGALLVANKSDLPRVCEAARALPDACTVTNVSSLHGDGVTDLIDAVVSRLVPNPPAPGAGVPFRSEQLDHLTELRVRLLAGHRSAALQHLAVLLHPRHADAAVTRRRPDDSGSQSGGLDCPTQ